MDMAIWSILEDKGAHVDVVGADAIVADAVAVMNARRTGSVVVVEDDQVVGIFTERDVLVRVVGDARDPRTTRVGEVMTTRLITVEPTVTVREAMALMTDQRCRHLPVIAGNRLLGLVSIGDVTRWLVRDQHRTIVDLTDYITHTS
jgi:CBS domain-containing protein